ncbi:MAG TPA: hypothetical protein VNI84_04580 [Pyrinomonadaceae bacterium]|nr:hypothetical protein [Pyrinomonadaceae bacterium]
MLNSLTKLYEGANVSGATPGVVYVPILKAGTIKTIDVLTDEAVAGANAVFSVSKNGAVIAGLSPTIAVGAKLGTVSNLNVALARGDEIILNLVSGAASSPVTFNVDIDDGQTALPAGSSSIFAGRKNPNPFDDEFEGSALNPAWTKTANGILQESHDDIIRSAYYARVNGSAADNFVYLAKPFVPDLNDFSITLCGAAEMVFQYNLLHLVIKNVDEQNHLQFVGSSSNLGKINFAVHRKENGVVAYGQGIVVADDSVINYPTILIHVQRINGLWSAWVSRNGIQWLKTLENHTFNFTVAKATIGFNTAGGTNKMSGVLHWVRRDWIYL